MNIVTRFYVLFCALAVSLAVNAQNVSGYPVGYCNGESGTSSKIKFDGDNREISAAVYINPSYAATVAGNSMEAIRVAICSKHNVESIRVWVKENLDDKEIAYGESPISEYTQGWNEITLASPYPIEEAVHGFYIGMTYTQKKKSGPMSIVDTSHAGALLIESDGNGYQDLSDQGTLCIEGLVYGDNLPRLNAQLISVKTDKYFIISNEVLSGTLNVRNLGVEDINELRLSMTIEGVDIPCHADVGCHIPFGETRAIAFSINPAITECFASETKAEFKIESINGADDEDMSDNTATAYFGILTHAYPKIALLEEFTTENCPNCPRVSEYIHDLMSNPEFNRNTAVICHHAGYGEDFLTTPFAKDFEWFYNSNGSTYAPALMIDRRPHGKNSPLFNPTSIEELAENINAALEYPAMVSVNIECRKADVQNGLLVFEVNGERTCADDLPDNLRLSVMIVENNIPAIHQAGVGTGYLHQHTGRAVNDIWGSLITWDGDSYSHEFSFTADSSWNFQNLQAVAFISSYNPENPLDCKVENAAIKDVAISGFDAITEYSERKADKIVSIDGRQLKEISKGVNIIVYTDGSIEKVLR